MHKKKIANEKIEAANKTYDAYQAAKENQRKIYSELGVKKSDDLLSLKDDEDDAEDFDANFTPPIQNIEVGKDKLSSHGRDEIKDSNFALPKERKYPIQDISHARNALARASGKPEESKVRAAVYAKYPSLNKDIKKGGVGDSDDIIYGLTQAQRHIEGIDWEMNEEGEKDESIARDSAVSNLEEDPLYYLNKIGAVEKDDTGADVTELGLNIDLGCGADRFPGYIGYDLYKQDHATIVHDLCLGIPLPDESCDNVRMVNSFGYMTDADEDFLMDEIARVLKTGGKLTYEDNGELGWHPELDMIDHESNEGDEDVEEPVHRQVFEKSEGFQKANFDDADDGLPETEKFIGADVLGYHFDMNDAPVIEKGLVKVAKVDKDKQIVYGVVLTPDEVDGQGDYITAEDIEESAHNYMMNYRIVGAQHRKPMDAVPVESFIAPQDLKWDGGMYGPQDVKKGAWVMAVKVNNPSDWKKVLKGEYTGFSVGGSGQRE